MSDPENIPKSIQMLKDRIEKKRELIKFTQMEIGELDRTVIKMERGN